MHGGGPGTGDNANPTVHFDLLVSVGLALGKRLAPMQPQRVDADATIDLVFP